jgi:hypothetical protein
LVTGVLVGLGAGAAEAKVPKAAFRYTAAIEPLAGYVGQSTCSPAAKPGTTAFANLLLRTYPSSRSLGISRACNVGGKSEHKEGRAFDWGVSAKSAADRAKVKALMDWLLKTDAYGNRYAMARRLGIQYMIWNHRIWGAYSAGAGWRKYTGSNPHTDHVHFSLSWAGARKNSSFWKPRGFSTGSGTAPKPKPAPDRPSNTAPAPGKHDYPDPRPDEHARIGRSIPEPVSPRRLAGAAPLTVERVAVLAKRRAGTLTSKALVAGHRYLLEVSGSYRYARKAGSLADAECSTRPGASWWQRDRSLRADQWNADHLDLYVDGHDLYAQSDGDHDCDQTGHTYRWVYEPQRTGRVPFAVWDPSSYKDNRGKLFVRVLDLSTVRDSMAWSVPAREKAGVTSPGLLRGGREYRVTVSGTWKNGQGGVADAECAVSGGSWRRDLDSYDMEIGDWSYGRLSPNVWNVRSAPVNGGSDCDSRHAYSFVYRPDHTTPLNIRVTDPSRYTDNVGALRVTVVPNDGSPGQPVPTPAPAPERESLEVDSHSPEPVRTQQSYPAGTSLRVTATGTYQFRGGTAWVQADAECTVSSGSYRWYDSAYSGVFNGASSPLGDLAVNGVIGTWNPVHSRYDSPCDRYEHQYTYDLVTREDGPLSFVIADDDYSDNDGKLQVEVAPR